MPIEKYLKKLIYSDMEINKQRSTVRSSATEAIIDQGLRSYMLKVYNYMASGVLLTGFVALLFFKMAVVTSAEGQIIGLTNFGNSIYASGLKWVIMLAPSLSSIFLIYTGASITRVFFITAGTFGAMSIYGYTTKRDLTKLGSFLMMGLFGIIIASLVNIFMKSSMMYFVISIIGVLVFVGLTAYDTQ